jgi:hypothetical protein
MSCSSSVTAQASVLRLSSTCSNFYGSAVTVAAEEAATTEAGCVGYGTQEHQERDSYGDAEAAATVAQAEAEQDGHKGTYAYNTMNNKCAVADCWWPVGRGAVGVQQAPTQHLFKKAPPLPTSSTINSLCPCSSIWPGPAP